MKKRKRGARSAKWIKLKTVLLTALCAVNAAILSGMTVFAEEGDASAASSAAEGAKSTGQMLVTTLALPVLLILFLYFFLFRPQQKQEKKSREMQKNLQVGDEVVTIGGIVGIVLRVEEATETVVLETGSDRLKIRMKVNAIAENVTAQEQEEAAKAAKKKERMQGVSSGKPKE